MFEGFGENVAPTDAIRAILGNYPFSIGLLREILQNTDDARATKQVFVLDRRQHGVKDLYHPYLAETQGPALLAFNDGLIEENDWDALKNIHQSSKTTDTSKIGKYGIGFRSCYHVTDTPHILSGLHLAILDPQHKFAEFSGVKIGGVKLNLEQHQHYGDNLAAFDSLLPRSEWGARFHGTIFRFPLRTSASRISDKTVSPDEISKLLRDFAAEELNISLLFLHNVDSIEIYEISANGERTQIANATIDGTLSEQYRNYEIRKATIRTRATGTAEKREWRIIHAPFSQVEAVEALSQRLGGDPTTALTHHKLRPTVDLAIPLDSSCSTRIGRLFTYLPLPLRTEFPVHINALFSLTQSRQNLRNAGEVGIVKKSDDDVLTEWNRLLFETYIPQAWATLLEVLVTRDSIKDIFHAWPSPQAENIRCRYTVEALSQRLGGDPTTALTHHKLRPTVDLAIPLDSSRSTRIGRLFTYLPLPLRTEFPVHINALFSLTQSRQNLRNAGEVGIVKKSDDDVLTEWNRLLFETYIPQAWATLLEVLVTRDSIKDIFHAWPSPQAEVYSGDYAYWKDIPLHVARYALDLPVWPVFGTNPPSYGTATSLLMAGESPQDNTLTILVRAGLSITRPPQYLTQIVLKNCAGKIEALSPKVAHGRLQEFTDKIKALNGADAQTILTYLLSTSDCHYIKGLPLIPSVTGSRISIGPGTMSNKLHTLLDETEEELFADYDAQAVSLKRLNPDVRTVLVNHGPDVLDVTKLGSAQVTAYLNASSYASRRQGAATGNQIHWLNKFWDWVQNWSSDPDFCDQFYLVPTTKGLRRPSETIFDPQDECEIISLLEVLSIPVIDHRFNTKARGALKQLQPSSNIHSLLHALQLPVNVEFSEDQAKNLCAYLRRHLPSSCVVREPISANYPLRSRLRALPIFPILSPFSNDTPSARRTSISSAVTVRGVDPLKVPILPRLDSVVYLDLRSIGQDMLQYIDQKHRFPLSIDEMHNLMLQNFKHQSLEMQVAYVKHLSSNSSIVSRSILDRLAATSFVPAGDGALRMPGDLVDPQARIAALFPWVSPSLPDTSRPAVSTLSAHLRSLNLFITDLSVDIIRDRIRFIAGGHCQRPEHLARTLINHINDASLDCRGLFDSPHLSLETEWIPTAEGLRSPLKCRDPSSHFGKKELFDEVMPMVASDIYIGFYLRRAFSWDGRVPFEVVFQQLIKVLEAPEPPFEKVREVVKELGHRSLTESELSNVRKVLQGRKWIPTRDGRLKNVEFALLGEEDVPEIGFSSVVFDSRRHSQVCTFLQRMGCVKRPSKETILAHLQSLHASTLTEPTNRRATQGLIRLLGWLPHLTPEERTSLFIPDINGTLRPYDDVCYNDVGPRAHLVDIGPNTLVHPNISPELAGNLGLKRLGLMSLQNPTDDEFDMGEDLMTTIRNRLREYTDSQLLLEFFANAADAGATEFNVLHDKQTAPTGALFSSRCAEFQRVRALVIHNNSTFSDGDFKGILRTGVGGKTSRKDTIGQFGLGALTMFHITEFAMIVSGDQVLFLNPCKAHLSIGRASLRLPLSRVRKLYGDHLSPLQGLFGFNMPSDVNEEYSYGGTLFRLPLRSSAQFLDVDPIFTKIASLDDIISSFKHIASDCLLFTRITSIRFFNRTDCEPLLHWSVTASRGDPAKIKENVDAHTVTITCPKSPKSIRTREWRILSLSARDQELLSFIPSLQEKYRLKLPPVVRIAACQPPAPRHKLFATLPLPIGLDLPVHISGSFILAPDRRSVRLDEYENDETKYNRRLLTAIVPELYLYLLEDRAQLFDNAIYWPGNSNSVSKEAHDTISSTVSHAVYEMAAMSENRIFRSKFYPHALTPQTVHIAAYLPEAVSKVLNILQPTDLIELPSSRVTHSFSDRIPRVSPMYVHDQIIANSSQFSAYMLKFDEIQVLIDYLSSDRDAHSCLLSLELLPLADGTFTKFQNSSESCFYVVPPESIEVFKPHRLVDSRLDTEKLLKIGTLNVKQLTGGDISTFLNDKLSSSPVMEDANPALREWIGKFWEVFPLLGVSATAIANYPLLPTVTPGNYVSISHCGTRSTIVADFTQYKWLSQCFLQMGFTLVDTACLSDQVLPEVSVTSLSVENVLSVLLDDSEPLSTMFKKLDPKNYGSFISWIQAHLSWQDHEYFEEHEEYNSLPIWKTVGGAHVSANEAVMLPQYIDEAIAPFASTPEVIVKYSSTLSSMGIQPVPSVQRLLKIPARLGAPLDTAYERLVRILLSPNAKATSVPVPNVQRAIKESNTLYSSQDDLFLAAFGTNSERFLLPSFRHLEDQLESFGLKRQKDLDISMFEDCVRAFQNATGPGLIDRAAVIFNVFSEVLPLRVSSATRGQWNSLDNLRFIPRDMSPIQLLEGVDVSGYFAPHIRFLSEIVSPRKLIRKEFKAIAWSQRSFYSSEPHQRVLMVYPNLGVPAAEEVVNHLIVLATKVAEDQVHNDACHATLLDQLEQTYKWLNEHTEDAEQFLRQCNEAEIPLFLNVDAAPRKPEDWNWKRADHIWLDGYDIKFLQSPRNFISSFRPLLIAAGAFVINPGEKMDDSDQLTSEDHLTNSSTSLNQMRKDGIFTDVSFICAPPDSKPVRAHRAILYAYNTYFRDMFSGSFRESGEASQSNPVLIKVEGFSRRCVECVLDYVYTMEEPKLQTQDADIDLALEMLSYMHFSDMTRGQRVMQKIIINLGMVNPFNLDHVRSTAEDTQSTELEEYCKAYEENNAELIQRVREDSANTARN